LATPPLVKIEFSLPAIGWFCNKIQYHFVSSIRKTFYQIPAILLL